MQVSWEALSALASAISSLAVLAAVVLAARQVRVGADQVEHLRKATQLEGTMKIFDKLASPEMQAARSFVTFDLEGKLGEPAYRAELRLLGLTPQPHPEVTVLRLMEMIGTYVKHGLLDEEIIFDYWLPSIVAMWETLEHSGVVAAHRESAGAAMWENFELLYQRAQRWRAANQADDVHPLWGQRDQPAGTKS